MVDEDEALIFLRKKYSFIQFSMLLTRLHRLFPNA